MSSLDRKAEILKNKAFPTVSKAQLLTYLKLSGLKLGMLLNFNVQLMKDGINRFVNNL